MTARAALLFWFRLVAKTVQEEQDQQQSPCPQRRAVRSLTFYSLNKLQSLAPLKPVVRNTKSAKQEKELPDWQNEITWLRHRKTNKLKCGAKICIRIILFRSKLVLFLLIDVREKFWVQSNRTKPYQLQIVRYMSIFFSSKPGHTVYVINLLHLYLELV